MRFVRVVLNRQIGKEIVLSDGNTMVVEKVNNTTVIGKVNNKSVSVSHNAVAELRGDSDLNIMLKRNIEGGLIVVEMPKYLDAKTLKPIDITKTKPSNNKKVEKHPSEGLVSGETIALSRDGELIIVNFESYNKDGDINCSNDKGERFQVPKERFISKVKLVS